MIVRVADPELPTFKQVSAVQEEINKRQGLRFRLVVQRTAVDVVGPKEKPNTESEISKQLIDSTLEPADEEKPIQDRRPFQQIPRIEQLPFLDNMQSFEEENSNEDNSATEPEEIKAPEFLPDSRSAQEEAQKDKSFN